MKRRAQRSGRALVLALLPALLLPAGRAGAADVLLPRQTELTAAAGDVVELERLGTRLGPARLLSLARGAMSRSQERPAAAAIRALGLSGTSHADVAAQALPGLIELLREVQTDKLAAATGEALARLCASLSHAPLCTQSDDGACGIALSSELRDELRGVPAALISVSTDAAAQPAARAQALLALSGLPAPLWRELGPRLGELAATAAPPVREAALGALGALASAGDTQELVQLIGAPTPPELASAAAAELCAPLVPRKPVRPSPGAPPAQTAYVLPAPVAERVRALAAPDQPLPQRQQVLDCLRVLGGPAERALIQAVLQSKPPARKPLPKTK